MPEERIIWRNKKAAGIYHREVARENPGVIDENYIKNYIISKRKVKVVSLGIGVGRELYWLDKLNNIKPNTLGQVSRIAGVSPADISILLIYLKSKSGRQ